MYTRETWINASINMGCWKPATTSCKLCNLKLFSILLSVSQATVYLLLGGHSNPQLCCTALLRPTRHTKHVHTQHCHLHLFSECWSCMPADTACTSDVCSLGFQPHPPMHMREEVEHMLLVGETAPVEYPPPMLQAMAVIHQATPHILFKSFHQSHAHQP
jgi:hypothetical protein